MRQYITHPRNIRWTRRCQVFVLRNRSIRILYSATSRKLSCPKKFPFNVIQEENAIFSVKDVTQASFRIILRKKQRVRVVEYFLRNIPAQACSAARGGGENGSICAFRYSFGHQCCVAYNLDNTVCSNTIPILCTGNRVSIVLTVYSFLC